MLLYRLLPVLSSRRISLPWQRQLAKEESLAAARLPGGRIRRHTRKCCDYLAGVATGQSAGFVGRLCKIYIMLTRAVLGGYFAPGGASYQGGISSLIFPFLGLSRSLLLRRSLLFLNNLFFTPAVPYPKLSKLGMYHSADALARANAFRFTNSWPGRSLKARTRATFSVYLFFCTEVLH